MKLPAHALIQMADQDKERIEARLDSSIRWTMVHEGDGSTGRMKLMRADMPSVLYRGQNRHYDPCWPSICRGFSEIAPNPSHLPVLDQARLLRGLALNSWFEEKLREHPFMQWAKSNNLSIDSGPIAQHYGIPTGFMDASESFEVSAFFATCRYSSERSSWEPMTQGEGVMYRLFVKELFGRASAICHQPFPRPHAQWGWTIELMLGEDFLQAPMLQQFTFDHDKSVGEEFLRRFDGGPKLLPPDPAARVAQEICAASELPIDHVAWAEDELANDHAGLSVADVRHAKDALVNQLKCSLTNASSIAFTQAEISASRGQWDERVKSFYQGVGFQLRRAARGGPEA